MKKIQITAIFFLFLHFIFANQFSYHFENSNVDGYQQSAVSYLDFQVKQWNIYNKTTLKFSEEKRELGIYYSRNYAKSRLKISRALNQFQFSTYLDLDYFPSRNLANQISGYPDFFHQKMGMGIGYEIKFQKQSWYLENELNYYYKTFKKNQVSDEENEHTEESDLILRTKFSAVGFSQINFFIEKWDFFDMNSSKLYNYQQTEGGIDFTRQLNRIHIVKQIISFGYSDVYPSIPYYLQTKTRFTSKFAQKYMLIQKYEMRFWMNDKAGQLYYGNGFAEVLFQRNFAFSPANDISQLQIGGKYYPSEERSIIKTNFQVFYKWFTWFGQYKYYYHFTNLNKSYEAGFRIGLFQKKMLLSYQFMYKVLKNMKNESIYRINLEMEF
jgi:hypothetical protein